MKVLLHINEDRIFGKDEYFNEELALAHLLVNEVVFINSHFHRDDIPEDMKETFSILVNCSDIFAWGTFDCEDLPFKELRNLYEIWRKDPEWGSAIWCMKKRNQRPQKPVEDLINKAGIWNIEELGLGPNTLDDEVTSLMESLCNNAIDKSDT